MKKGQILSLVGPVLIALFLISNKIQNHRKSLEEKPNILWIVSEDNSPYLGCYGDPLATTPALDKLASEGVLYTNAFANAPVCAAARSTIITGMYPPAMGTQNMRSRYNIPNFIKFFPEYLRKAGYYTTNNSKTDYNAKIPEGVWDESSNTAHYKNRKEGQPFFSVFNIGISHESCIHKKIPTEELRHDPAKMILPPYHPDTPEMRHDWAQFYDKIEDMDSRVAQLLDDLDKSGLAENTIVVYYSDHGGIIARSKRFLYETGTRVPMIWKFPKKYEYLAPARPNAKIDRLVSFVDLAPTMLSLAGIKIPDYMQGKAFLGSQQSSPREYVHLFSDRMDERFNKVRAVRDKQFRYIKNYMPHRIYGEHLSYLWQAPSTLSWESAYKNGNCNEVQSVFWNQKPPEELYDVKRDPWEINNLATNPEYEAILVRLRSEKDRWMDSTRDSGLIPEGELSALNDNGTIFDYVHSNSFDYNKIKHAADVSTMRDKNNLSEIISFLKDDNANVRYWGAMGCLILGKEARIAKTELKELLKDKNPDVRITAAEALCGLDEYKISMPIFIEDLHNSNEMTVLHVMNSLTNVNKDSLKAIIPVIKGFLEKTKLSMYEQRTGQYLLEEIKN